MRLSSGDRPSSTAYPTSRSILLVHGSCRAFQARKRYGGEPGQVFHGPHGDDSSQRWCDLGRWVASTGASTASGGSGLESRDEPDGGDPMQEVEEQERGEELPAEDQAAVENAQERWNKYVQEKESVETTSLTWAVPLASRKRDDIIAAAAQGYSRLRALGIPVIRVHTDRAREFTSKSFRMGITTLAVHDVHCGG